MYAIKDYIIKSGKFILNWKNKPSGLYNAKYVGFAHKQNQATRFMIPFYCFKTVLSDSIYVISKTVNLIVSKKRKRKLFM